ncbi:hypothetical protein KY290_021183 [Solanum tuberosum]|uniref:Uncharacterized protein n=1 Tax=Solanum tuberosum TaxID=4113 RepID=A0ABQ7V3W5_SOLTU|nr:hypothetical protein KY289_020358 [Solanum tuberosum]KAH0695499.1 hypothetical protein KY285_022596 [Solanum tuberosum]KAH0757690.1 hypothetical protein KY290_021183 [Solanum tuberosum]
MQPPQKKLGRFYKILSKALIYFSSRLMAIVNQLSKYRKGVEDVRVVEKILHSVKPKFDYVVCPVEHSKYLYSITVKKVTKEMDNGEVVETVDEEKVISTNSIIKIKVTGHSELVAVVNKEVEDVEPIKVPVKCEKANLVDNNKDEDESTLLMSLKEEDTDDCNSWYLHNGARNYICG